MQPVAKYRVQRNLTHTLRVEILLLEVNSNTLYLNSMVDKIIDRTIEKTLGGEMKTTASDIMSRKVLKAYDGISVEDAVKLLVNNQITGLPVVDQENRLIGVLSEFDIIAQISKHKKLSPKAFQEQCIFTKETDSVTEHEELSKILDRFIQHQYRRLPVVNQDGQVIGIISRRDIIRLFYYRAKLD